MLVTEALCGCAITVCPCELFSQLNINVPGFVFPFKTVLPVPFGASSMLAFDVVTISCPLTSRSPPSCGDESSERLFMDTACALASV